MCFHGRSKKDTLYPDEYFQWLMTEVSCICLLCQFEEFKRKTGNFSVPCANEHPRGLVKVVKRKSMPELEFTEWM